MLDAIKLLADEVAEALIQPRIDQIRIDIKLALATGFVVALFSLLAMACLFMIVFFAIANATNPTEAAVILLAICVVTILGALVAHGVGRKAERRLLEERLFRRRRNSFPEAGMPDLQIGRRVRETFADNKLAALAVVAVLGMMFGHSPGTTMRVASKLVRGRRRDRDSDERAYRRRR